MSTLEERLRAAGGDERLSTGQLYLEAADALLLAMKHQEYWRPEMNITEIRFESDCYLNGVLLKAGTTINSISTDKLTVLAFPAATVDTTCAKCAKEIQGVQDIGRQVATPQSADGDDLMDAMNTLRAIALSVNNGDALGHLTSYRYRIRQKLLAETNAAPQGVKTVPVFPTEEMQIAGAKAAGEGFASGYIVGIYKAMVHAAPQEASPSHYDCTSLPDCPICGGGGKGCGACDCTGKVGWPK